MMGDVKNDQTRKLSTIKEQTHRMGMITKKLMGFKEYSTREYVGKSGLSL